MELFCNAVFVYLVAKGWGTFNYRQGRSQRPAGFVTVDRSAGVNCAGHGDAVAFMQ